MAPYNKLVFTICVAACLGCSSHPWHRPTADGVDSAETLSAVQLPIYGDNTKRDNSGGNSDTSREDIVVRIIGVNASGIDSVLCSGTLITPTLVLTARHCTWTNPAQYRIGIGPTTAPLAHEYVVPASSMARMAEGGPESANTNSDVAIIRLGTPVLGVKSRRPMVWDGWEGNGTFGDSVARFGIAGWSPKAGPLACTPGETEPTDLEHERWRQSAEWMAEGSFFHHDGDDTIETYDDNHNKAQRGDSGGPLYHMLMATGEREAIGVLSLAACDTDVLGNISRLNFYTDVTHGVPFDWISSIAKDINRGTSWYNFHGKNASDYWRGEADYTGPCTTPNNLAGMDQPKGNPPPTQDLDCDHWYDVHDNCPVDYNPDQADDSSGHGLACIDRLGIDGWDPANPASATSLVTIGNGANCIAEQPNCPASAAVFTELTGQYWQSPDLTYVVSTGHTTSPKPRDPKFFGSWLRIDATTDPVSYMGDSGIVPDLDRAESYAPPHGKPSFVAFRDIKSIVNPAACFLKVYSIGATSAASSSINLSVGNHSFSVLSGLWGNLGSPDFDGPDSSLVRVANSPGGTSTFSQVRDASVSPYVNFGAEAIVYDCPGSYPFTPYAAA